MKDLEIDRLNAMGTEQLFIRFLTELFSAKNLIVVDEGSPNRRADLAVRQGDDEAMTLVELKLHRSKRIAERAVHNALLQMARMMQASGAAQGIVIFTQPIDRRYLNDLPPGVVVWDLDELVRQTRNFPSLATDLADLLKILQVGAERPPEEAGRGAVTAMADLLEGDDVASPDPAAGAVIVKELRSLAAGKTDASAFEKVCQRALELMFGNDFAGWRPQNQVDAGFHRMDLIGRLVATENPFWSTLASDFRTRYVVFEFKNYTDAISQEQIYTTEKYLFVPALRSVALVVARNGVSESAMKAIRGSLREQGKLILAVSLDEFCSMLLRLDDGGDPTDELYGKLDDLLMTIGR
ncbi:hypothetical protein [Sphingomonas sanguinis]|uniref:Restriction endonuclease type IV Mrr domain-containing protein n=1 Tax=Sphingomonas sanguinis TaxID=33051 RepID=A0A147J1E6_9SPHN|nr:hypothetical protein [Sphingomonas sanguinis]KTW01990.1 hypothetical protein SB4_04650 [Sphingomonas sanguinis]